MSDLESTNDDGEVIFDFLMFLGYDIANYHAATITEADFSEIAILLAKILKDIDHPSSLDDRDGFNHHMLVAGSIERISIEPSPITAYKDELDKKEHPGIFQVDFGHEISDDTSTKFVSRIFYMSMLIGSVLDFLKAELAKQHPEKLKEFEQEIMVRKLKGDGE